MPNDSRRTVLVSLGAGLGVALAKAGAAAFTGSRHGRRGVAFTRRYRQRPVPVRGSASQPRRPDGQRMPRSRVP